MAEEVMPSDVAILDLLRRGEGKSVSELALFLQVTATAVRQRLNRLMAQGYIERQVIPALRGRPSHRYTLTQAGRRKTGANFADLAIALWEEIREIEDPEVRRGLLKRISARMAKLYASEINGRSLEEKMQSLADLFGSRQVPFEVALKDGLPVLNALACPYPDLAEQDRSICALERLMFSDLLGENVRLASCRLTGEDCCTFQIN